MTKQEKKNLTGKAVGAALHTASCTLGTCTVSPSETKMETLADDDDDDDNDVMFAFDDGQSTSTNKTESQISVRAPFVTLNTAKSDCGEQSFAAKMHSASSCCVELLLNAGCAMPVSTASGMQSKVLEVVFVVCVCVCMCVCVCVCVIVVDMKKTVKG